MSRVSLDEHQDALLTDAEREALGEDAPPEPNAAADADGPGDDEPDEDADEGEDDEGAATDSAAAPAVADDADDAAGHEAGADDAEAETRLYEAKLPTGFEDLVAQNKDAMAALRRKRDEGEISNSEFDAEQDRLLDEREDLRRMQTRHDVSEDMRRQAQQALVNAAWGRTLKAADADGVDYRADKAKHADFDMMIKALAAKPENDAKPLQWFFAEAHKRVLALHGLAGASKTAEPASPADNRKAVGGARKPDLSNLPKTLADVPGGTGADDVGGDEFADLDDLDGMDFEDALAARLKRDPNFDKKFTAAVKGNAARRSVRAH